MSQPDGPEPWHHRDAGGECSISSLYVQEYTLCNLDEE
jgi:hypothetical protein